MKSDQWVKPFLFTLLIVITPLVGYYLYFVESRETFLLDRYHAHLANMAVQTEARFSSAFNIITHNAGNANVLGVSEDARPCAAQVADAQNLVKRMAGNQLKFSHGDCEALVDASALVGNVDPDRQFYDVLILEEEGRVVFQLDGENGRIADNQLALSGDGDDDSDSDSDSDSTISDPFSDMRIMYQGRPFLMFTQPLIVVSSEGSWMIVGLLEQARFNQLKYAVRSGGIVLVALLLLSALFTGPFLKLWYLGRFEPLTRFDIVLQTGAGLCLVAMVTVAALGWNTYSGLSDYFDSRLMSITENFKKRLETEFTTAVTTLAELEPIMIESYEHRLELAPNEPFESPIGECSTLADEESAGSVAHGVYRGPTLAGDVLSRLKDETAGYRQLIMSYIMDQNGCQVVKWSSEAQPPNPGQFEDRNYFTRVLPDERISPELYGSDPSYFQEVIISRTTGERQIIFSKAVSDPTDCEAEISARDADADADADANEDENADEPPDPLPCVSVLSARSLTFETVLPYGYGVMLVDGASDIVLRSDGDASTEHNLANEISNPERFRATIRRAVEIQAETDELFDADYGRRPHRVRVTPLAEGDLALVAFYDKNLVMTVVLDSMGAAVVSWLIWMSILITLFLVCWIADDMTERALRRWPANLGVGLLVVIALFLLASKFPTVLPWAALIIPLSLLPLRFLTREERYRMDAHARRGLVVLATWLSVMLAGAIPITVLYLDAQNETLGAVARFQAQEYDHAVQLQKRAFNQWKYKVGLADQNDWNGLEEWQNEHFLLRDEEDRLPELKLSTSECSSIVCFILQSRLGYNTNAIGLQEMYRSGSLDPKTKTFTDLRAKLLETAPHTQALSRTVATLFLALTPVIIWYLLIRTFGLRAENVVRMRSFALPQAAEKVRYIMYGVPAQKRHQYLQALPGDGKLWIDLRDMPADGDIDIPASTDSIALDQFDVNLNDIKVVRQRVNLLERLLREQHRAILLFVSTEPLNFVTSMYDAEDEKVLLSRFATALSRFKLIYPRSVEWERPDAPLATAPGRFMDLIRRCVTRPFQGPDWQEQLVSTECRHPNLWHIRDDLLKEPELQNWSKAQIVQQIQSRANAIYQHMWHQCTRIEKFTLVELARGNPINPNNWDAARRLRLRGYVRTDPFYRIASESLRQFVSRAEHTEKVRTWSAESPGAWSQIKVPLMVLLIGGLVFVAVTQPGVFNNVFAFMVAGAASLPFLISAMNARLQRTAQASDS